MVTPTTMFNAVDFADPQAFMNEIASHYTDVQDELLQKTIACAEQHQRPNTLRAGYDMALMLHSLHADYKVVAAALLMPLILADDALLATFATTADVTVLNIIQGALKMDTFLGVNQRQRLRAENIEGLRKMLTSMINDVRIVLLKLVERLFVLRHIKETPSAKRRGIAEDIMRVYAPLANRLGIGELKWELEDRAFLLLDPVAYQDIATKLSSKRIARERYIQQLISDIEQDFKVVSIEADIKGRAKHIYSIWRKMQQKHLDFTKLFDVLALRVLVKDVSTCYSVLSLLQEKYSAVLGEFSDYIATPKANGYQSIHTVIIGPDARMIEVQIRTHTMDEASEKGVAAHWRYKEGSKKDVSDEARINWLRSLLEWQSDLGDTNEAYHALAQRTIDEQVYVFTPQGDVLDFPKGATPLDFAYRVHSDIGHRCTGAKVQGKMVPLTYTLKTGDRIDIITSKTSTPSRDWLQSGAGYLLTHKAKAKVTHWFRQQNKTKNTALGKEMFMKALKRLKVKSVDYDKLMKPYSLQHVDDFFAGIATGDVRLNQVLGVLSDQHKPEQDNKVDTLPGIEKSVKPSIKRTYSGVIIADEPHLLSHMAGCCKPVYGDLVIGFVTHGRGVSIHRQDCAHIKRFRTNMADRLLSASWGEGAQRYQTDLTIIARNQDGVLQALTNLMSNEGLSFEALTLSVNHKRQEAIVRVTVRVESTQQVTRLLHLIHQQSFVLGVKRD